MGVDLPRRVDTVYLGGGTPSLLAPDLLARLFAAMRSHFEFDPDAEITVECAPGQLAGRNPRRPRQPQASTASASASSPSSIAKPHASGRLHSRAIVADDLARLRAAGIANLNLDLIAGLAGQTFASPGSSRLAILIESACPPRQRLHARSRRRLPPRPRNALRRRALPCRPRPFRRRHRPNVFDRDRALKQAGLAQYEISNFARPGFESRHNLRYWQRRPYLGLGLDASSMLRATAEPSPAAPRNSYPAEEADPGYVLRSTTTDDLTEYLAGPGPIETAWLSPDRQHEEAWFLGLRRNAGVDAAALEREFGRARVAPALLAAARLAEDGLVECDGPKVRLTPQGRLLSNDVFQEFLGLELQQI
jgi:oxygen-independent coproporphyrinogen-3 oxidase